MTRLMTLDVSFIEAHIKAMSTSRCSITRKAALRTGLRMPAPSRTGSATSALSGALSSGFAASRRGSGFPANGPGPLNLDSPVPATPSGMRSANSLMGPPLPLPEHSARFELPPLAPVEPADVGVALAPGSVPPAPGSAGPEARAELVRQLTAMGFSAEVRAWLRPPAARGAARG
jgi:hypothetical protein